MSKNYVIGVDLHGGAGVFRGGGGDADQPGGLIYDDVLSITWLANANLAGTETFDLTRSSNENPTLDVNVITRWRKMHRW